MKENQDKPAAADLRRIAEERLSARPGSRKSEARTAEDPERLLYELDVYQIELEMQNEELRAAYAKAGALLTQYTDLYDFAPTGYLTLDHEGTIRQVNLTGARELGFERSRLVGRRFGQFVAEGDRCAFADFLEKVLTSQVQESCEVMLPKEGSLPLFVRIEGLRTEDGQECRVVVLDITERKKAEDALREREVNFRVFFNTVDDIILVGSPDGAVIYANPAASRKLGYSQDELKTMHLLDLHPADRRQEAEAIFAAMVKGEQESCPLPLARKDGRLVPVETRVWTGQWNGADCVFGVSKDLTKEQEALQKFDRLFRYNPSPLAVASLLDQRFTDINEAWLRALGYTRAEVLGKTVEELDLFVDPEAQRRAVEELQAHGHLANYELKVRRKDGAVLDGLFFGELIGSQGEKSLLTVMLDLTARKRAEAGLVQQLDELRRWQAVTLGRESRVGELKREVNVLAARLGQPPPYATPEGAARKENG